MRNLVSILFAGLICSASAWSTERINPFANPNFVASPTPSGPAGVPAELTLRAVMPSASNSLANINGQLLRIGDDYHGYVLTDVTAQHVTLRKNDQNLVLELRPRARNARGEQS